MNSVVAIVVTYNRLSLLKLCIDSLKSQSVPCDILLIDNASTDGTHEWAQDQKDIQYYNTGNNIGGAGGFNIGMRIAAELGYEYIWLMDDDTLPFPNALNKLLEADKALNGNYGWLSSVALWKDGTECKMNRQKLKKSFYEYSPLLKHGIVQAEQATFVSLFLQSKTVVDAGLPVKEFFIWGDDIEYTRRIAVRENIPCFVAGQSQVLHAMQENTGSSIVIDKEERLERYRYAYRNEAFLYRKEGFKGVCYYLGKCGWNFLQVLFKAPNYRWKRLKIIISSMFCGLFFNPKIEK